ncbi:sensor histidine kinase [Sphingomonas sp. ID1715]|uniref:sensor histidine kinase n=1 Tax=Sphingomonas sp. ID1715 TaxID=1656898 RepID=UPI001489A7C5|nr:sensor histidine kinase [Sphingomonas sp. ID1715]NNM76856.1 sensor histidine kinase [Sphingomonas sp. ID1715]
MASAVSARGVGAAAVEWFARLSAGLRLLILLTLALLPLGLLAVFASLQISRSADLERRASVRIAAMESARRLGSELAVDGTTLRAAVNLLERGADAESICARAQSVLATSFGEATRYAIVTRGGRPVCGALATARRLPAAPLRSDTIVTLSGEGMTVVLSSDTRAFVALAFYPRAQLVRSLRPAGFTGAYNLVLSAADRELPLIEGVPGGGLARREIVTAMVPNAPIELIFSVRSAPFTPAEILTMLVPIIMWLVALLVAWIVFNRLVIAPLGQLRANIATYQPGEIFTPLRRMTIPAREISELGQTFQTISHTVAAHEEELALGLSRQTRLTREVHHRVKNNLQVVSSLINLHARAAKSPEATAAYSSISRRVDALAVVHRNHYAELEENRGVNLRSLIGELAANLRATAPGEANRLAILIDAPVVHVGQDTAIPIAFLTTELVELAMSIDPAAAVRISVLRQPEPGRACLVVASPALSDGERLEALLAERYGRVLEGLSRQLRSPLERDRAAGSFQVCFPMIVESDAEPKK